MRRNVLIILWHIVFMKFNLLFSVIFIQQRLCELLWTTEIWERKENSDRPNRIGFAEEWNGMSFHKYNLNSNHLYFFRILHTSHLIVACNCMCVHAHTLTHIMSHVLYPWGSATQLLYSWSHMIRKKAVYIDFVFLTFIWDDVDLINDFLNL